MRNYLVNAEYGAERVGDKAYTQARKAAAAWEPIAELPESYCGNITSGLVYDVVKAKFKYVADSMAVYQEEANGKLLSNCQVMPSALWLYRLLCLFQCTVHSEGPDGYKLVWQIALKHKATGEVLVFREWKGGFSLGHSGSGRIKNGSFEKDMLALLSALASKECPHPYDGTVAGSVA